ncbi:MAG: hypothetical protein IT310_12540 [Anaerolineales bacterium]|nr:hypothetical protein [Anaerolineales bacterium]
MIISSLLSVGLVVILISVGLLVWMFLKSNQTKANARPEKPLFKTEEGERQAAPFAEQIEDLLRAKVSANPQLKNLKLDLGTAPDGGLEIWVDEKKYSSVDELPNEQLKDFFQEAVKIWENRK